MTLQIQVFVGNTNKSATETRRKSSFFVSQYNYQKVGFRLKENMCQSDLLTYSKLSSFTELFLYILLFSVYLNIITLRNLHLLLLLHCWLKVPQSCDCAKLPSGYTKCLYTSWPSIYPKKASISSSIFFVVKALKLVIPTHQLHFTVYLRNSVTLLCLKVTRTFAESGDVSKAKQ